MRPFIKPIFAMFLLIILSCSKTKENVVTNPTDTLSMKGADISFLPEIRKFGISARNRDGKIEDMLITLKNEGCNTIRLRLWHNPANEFSSFDEVRTFANEIKNLGMKVMLTIHYSDTWADPGKQTKPKAWNNISFATLKDSVYNYTSKVVKAIKPEYIQIGNEINNGLIWPDGNISKLTQMKEILAAGVKATRDGNPSSKIIIQYAGHEEAYAFYDKIKDIDYDIMGLSYYPLWHGKNVDSLKINMDKLANGFGKEIAIVETSYPFTLGFNDKTNNIVGLQNQILPAFPATPQGQLDFLMKLKDIVKSTPKGIGFAYWAPEWVSFKGSESIDGSPYENQALWGYDNKALIGIKVYNE